jgi:hypothetical protein
LLDEIQAKGVEPDVITYAAVIDAVVDQLIAASRDLLKKVFAPGLFARPVPTSARSWELDLHDHSEGSAVTAVRWWLEEEVVPWLGEHSRQVCIPGHHC